MKPTYEDLERRISELEAELEEWKRDCRALSERTGTVPLARFEEAVQLGQRQANDFDRYWKAAGVLASKVTVDDAIARYRALVAGKAASDTAIVSLLGELRLLHEHSVFVSGWDHVRNISARSAMAVPMPWVPCSERLPEIGDKVWVFGRSKWMGVCLAHREWEQGRNPDHWVIEGRRVEMEDVTHWMPYHAPVPPPI